MYNSEIYILDSHVDLTEYNFTLRDNLVHNSYILLISILLMVDTTLCTNPILLSQNNK